ncbi:MAG: ATP-binding protein [Myxococcaceae bacterium]
MNLQTLRARLVVWYGIVLAATLLVFGGVTYWVVTDSELDEQRSGVEDPQSEGLRVLMAVGIAFPFAIALSLSGAWWLTRRNLQPLEHIERTVRELGLEQLDRRVTLDGRSAQELRSLAQSFNAMLERLQKAVEGVRQFTADASHQLRTPLTVLRGELEITLRRPRSEAELRAAMENALKELERLSSLVFGLLTLARSDAGDQVPLVAVELEPLVRKVVSSYEAGATRRALRVEVSGSGVTALAEPNWLFEAVSNLVDNAYKFTPDGGLLGVEVLADGTKAVIRVSDSGPGFGGGDTERFFERFRRGATTQGQEGFGLGLPIARAVVRAMGGEVRAQTVQSGAQTQIELSRS